MKRASVMAMLMLVAVAGCATEGKFRENMDSWLGHPVSDVVAQWGSPAQVVPIGNEKAYLWKNNGPVVYAYGMASQVSCDITLITDSSETIRKWQSRGNACKAK